MMNKSIAKIQDNFYSGAFKNEGISKIKTFSWLGDTKQKKAALHAISGLL